MSLLDDLRYATRSLRRTPAFTIAAIATLAIGIGANTAIFSLIDAIMLRPLPVQRPDELMLLRIQEPGREPGDGVTNAMWEAARDQLHARMSAFAWSSALPFDLTTAGGVRQIDGDIVSGSYFPVLGVAAAAGRLLTEADDRAGCQPVAVLGFDHWQTQFGGSPSAIGSTMVLNRQSFRVIGVAARGFHGMETGRQFDVAVPICASAHFDRRNVGSRNRWWLFVGARVPAPMTMAAAQTYLDARSRAVMEASVPNGDAAEQKRFVNTRLVAAPLATGASGLRQQFATGLRVLMGAVVVVLLIACANIASLILARGTARSGEIAIRAALGASRRRLVRQLMTESLLIAGAGATLGIVLANAGARLLVRGLTTARYPVYMALPVDDRILAFAVGLGAATAVLVGLFPAVRLTRSSMRAATNVRRGASTVTTLTRRHGAWIVSTQIALSLVLLVAGGLLLRTFVNLVTLDPGFDRENLVVVAARAPWFAADTVTVPVAERMPLFDTIAERLREIPGVSSVARAFTTPIGDDNWVQSVAAEGIDVSAGDTTRTYLNRVTPGYFETLRTPLIAGRDFDRRDTAASTPVAIVNESFVRR
jgi:predicted permease